MTARALLAALVLAASPALADEPPPDPAVTEAAEANLLPAGTRENVVLTAAVGGSLTIGLGINDAVGRGGSLSLRLGKVANARWLVTVELATYALLHRFAGTLHTNTEATLQVGGQYYVRPKLWLRFAGGVGFYRGEMVLLESGARGRQELRGLAGTVGAGLDLVRWGRVIVGLELASTGLATRDGLLSSSALLLGLSLD